MPDRKPGIALAISMIAAAESWEAMEREATRVSE